MYANLLNIIITSRNLFESVGKISLLSKTSETTECKYCEKCYHDVDKKINVNFKEN